MNVDTCYALLLKIEVSLRQSNVKRELWSSFEKCTQNHESLNRISALFFARLYSGSMFSIALSYNASIILDIESKEGKIQAHIRSFHFQPVDNLETVIQTAINDYFAGTGAT